MTAHAACCINARIICVSNLETARTLQPPVQLLPLYHDGGHTNIPLGLNNAFTQRSYRERHNRGSAITGEACQGQNNSMP